MGFSGGSVVKNPPANRRRGFDPWVGKIPWRRKGQRTPVFLPGKFHGQRSLAGYSPWDHRVRHELVTEQAHTHTHRNEDIRRQVPAPRKAQLNRRNRRQAFATTKSSGPGLMEDS